MRFLLLFALLLWAVPAGAAQEQDKLEQVQKQIEGSATRQEKLAEQTSALGAELDSLRRKLIAATSAADKSSEALQELENSLNDLEGAAARRADQLSAQREQLSQTLALLERLALTPPATQLLSPTPPIDRLRTDMELKALLPQIQSRAQEIAATVNDLRALRNKLESQRTKVLAERNQWQEKSRELDRLIAERNQRLAQARNQNTQEKIRAARLASQAQSLRELLDRLQEQPGDIKPAQPVALPAGAARRLPVSAPALTRFGQRDSYGNLSKGITLRPRMGSPVAAVASGRVAFAGPFRGYGRILILSHPGGYHTVVAGLGDVQVDVGETVAAGEPLGRMPETADPPPELYYEVRFEGTPIDPLGSQAQSLVKAR